MICASHSCVRLRSKSLSISCAWIGSSTILSGMLNPLASTSSELGSQLESASTADLSTALHQDDVLLYGIRQHIFSGFLALLHRRIGVASMVLRGVLQHRQRARVIARATIKCRRIVAIECVIYHSGR